MSHFSKILFLLPLLASAARAQTEIPLAREQVRIAPGATQRFEFGTVPQQDTVVTLEVSSRLDAKQALGSNMFLRLALNGKEIQAARSRTAIRLLNKPIDSPVTGTISASWFGGARGWRVVYAPDFQVVRKVPYYVGDPYTLELDVTDLINPAAENRLEVTNTADGRAVQAAGTEAHLVLEKLNIRTRPGKSAMVFDAPAASTVINRGEPAAGPAAYKGQLTPGGGFSLTVGTRRWDFTSAFSYPNAGFNVLSPTKLEATATWAPRATPETTGGTVTAQGKYYDLRRQVRFTPRRVEVEDTLTNKGDTALGLHVRHETSLAGLSEPPVRIAGNPDPAVSDYYSPGNPSVLVQAADHQLGLLCEDDILRNQGRLYVRPEQANAPAVAGIRTEMLRLVPRESVTLKWAVYPVGGKDYFDFVNLVRQDWGANFTVQGAWYWGYRPDAILAMPEAEIRDKFNRLGIKYTTIGGGWIDSKHDPKRIGFGTGVLDPYWDDYRQRVRESAIKLRRAVPGLKVLAYYDSQRDTSENSSEKFRDSWLTNPDGTQHFTDWSGQFSRTFSTAATLDNSYGRAMLATAERYMEEMGLDGIYWDEMENTMYGSPLITYNLPDGHSCELDPRTFTIKREIGITGLLSHAHRLEVIRRVQARGGTVLGNGPTGTRALLATGVQRMVESQHNDNWPAEGHLQTPLGYISSKVQWSDFRRLIGLGLLPVGTRLDYTHEISAHLFPFTPVELHAGYLLGKERIVVDHDGSYGWSGEKTLVLPHRFDAAGKPAPGEWSTRIGTEAKTTIKLADTEMAVLERIPVQAQPRMDQMEILVAKYAPDEIRLRHLAGAGELRIAAGTFPVEAGATYSVQIPEGIREVKAVNGVLSVHLAQQGEVLIRPSGK